MKNVFFQFNLLTVMALLTACHHNTVEDLENEREHGINPFYPVDIENEDVNDELKEAQTLRQNQPLPPEA